MIAEGTLSCSKKPDRINNIDFEQIWRKSHSTDDAVYRFVNRA
jgi:hypothetical protein